MLNRLISNQIDSSTSAKARETMDMNENQPLLNILLPEVLERLLITESVLHLDRSSDGFNGIPEIHTTPYIDVTRAIIVNDRNKFVYQQVNRKDRPSLALYENGILIPNDEDIDFPIDHEDSLREVKMRDLLTTFLKSTIKRLDTLPPTPVLSQPGFRFTSIHSGKSRPTEHIAIAKVNPSYWE